MAYNTLSLVETCSYIRFLYVTIINKPFKLYILFIGTRWYCPKLCGHHYKKEQYLIRHLQQECGVMPQYPCYRCKRRFKRISDMKRHLLMCANEPGGVKCEFCDKMFWRKDLLKTHKASRHNRSD